MQTANENTITLNQLIVDFLASLPETIRKDVCSQVYCLSTPNFGGNINPQDIENLTYSTINPADTHHLIPALFTALSTIDHVLCEFTQDKVTAKMQELGAEGTRTHNQKMQKTALRHAMRQKHFVLAYENWNSLRTTHLSHDNIAHLVSESMRHQMEYHS